MTTTCCQNKSEKDCCKTNGKCSCQKAKDMKVPIGTTGCGTNCGCKDN